MKFRKPLAILLAMALSLGVTPIASVSGAEQSTTLSGGTVTDIPGTPDDGIVKVIDDTIKVTIKNKQYKVFINPYGMTIDYPDESGNSEESIVSTPLYIENNSGVPVDITATATATPNPEGTLVLDSEPTRDKKDSPHTPDGKRLKEQRVYLYLQMMKWDGVSSVGNNEWEDLKDFEVVKELEEDKEGEDKTEEEDKTGKKWAVITKPGGSAPLTVEMPEGGGAAIRIGGETSAPTYYGAWDTDGTFNVDIVLSFLPKQKEGYSVTFEIEDIYGPGLKNPVKIELQGVKDSKTAVLEFNKDKPGPQTVVADESLTFNIKVSESYSEGYLINCVYLIHLDKDGNEIAGSEELMYEDNYTGIIEWTKTINASKVNLNETLKVKVFVEDS